MVLAAEIVVDWLKHAFITRFNEIPSNVYQEYTLSLAYDLAQTKQKNVSFFLNRTIDASSSIVSSSLCRLSQITLIWLLAEWDSFLFP